MYIGNEEERESAKDKPDSQIEPLNKGTATQV